MVALLHIFVIWFQSGYSHVYLVAPVKGLCLYLGFADAPWQQAVTPASDPIDVWVTCDAFGGWKPLWL